MGTASVEERVNKRTSLKPIVFKSSLPLANPETIFTYGTWCAVLNFAANYLEEQRRKFDKNLEITIRDLYFRKFYFEPFDFKRAEELFAKLGQTEFCLYEPNDRDDERSLIIGENKEMQLYEFHKAVCFSVVGAVDNDGPAIKDGDFERKPTVWRMHGDKFLAWVNTLEQALMGQGQPMACRVFVEVKTGRVTIAVKCFYEEPFLETHAKIWKGLRGVYRKHIKSEFTIAIN